MSRVATAGPVRRVRNTVLSIAVVLFGGLGVIVPATRAAAASGVFVYMEDESGPPYSLQILDTSTDTVTDTIALPADAISLAANDDGTRLFVLNQNIAISVFDTTTNTDIAEIPVGGDDPVGLAVSPDGSIAYVGYEETNEVKVVDIASGTVTDTIPVGDEPAQMAVTPDGSRLFVADFAGNTVTVVDTASDAVVDTIAVAARPQFIVISPDGMRAYVSAFGSLTVIDTTSDTVVANVLTPGRSPETLAINPAGTRLYSADGMGGVEVVDTTTDALTTTVPVDSGPEGIAVTPDGSKVYTGGVSTVSVIDTTSDSVTATLAGFHFPWLMVLVSVPPPAPPTPVVTAVSPQAGPLAAGTPVTVTGTGLTDAMAVTFGADGEGGGLSCTDTICTVLAPAGTTGTVDVTVTTPGGTSATSAADRYTYVPPPLVTGVSPSAGPLAAGTAVTVTGTDLSGVTRATFGADGPATIVSCSVTSCDLLAPAGTAGAVDVTVTSLGGTSPVSSGDRYTYTVAPVVTAISPYAGPLTAGTQVAIAGSNLAAATTVKFGLAGVGTGLSCTATLCTVLAPASTARTVDVRVTAPTGTSATSAADKYTFAPVPSVTSVTPSAGPLISGTSVRIVGTGLATTTAVTFGPGALATGLSCTTTTCTGIAPSGAPGTVDVQVTTAGGTSTTSSADRYTYTPPPVVTAVSPNAGPLGAGTPVTISGTDLVGASAVTFGGKKATTVVCGATSCTAKAPSGTAGTVDVQVATDGGVSATSPADQYTYVATPVVTAVGPSAGPLSAGTTVTVTGTNLSGATAITFGAAGAATGISCTSTACTLSAPAGSPGTVNVTVTTVGGTSVVSTADRYTYTAAPTVTGVSPATGSVAGGDTVTVSGTNLAGVTEVDFGVGDTGTVLSCTARSCTVTAPAGSPGTVDIQVVTAGGISGAVPADRYTYQ